MIDSSVVWNALWLSLLVAAVASVVVAVIGTALGRHLAVRRYRGKELIDAFSSLPLFLPPTVLGYYLTVMLGRRSVLGSYLAEIGIEFTFTWLGAALAGAVVSFPLMVRAARIAFEGMVPELEESAGLDGASRWQTFWHITMPLARSGLIGGVVLAFARAIGEFGATLMVSGNIPGKTQTMPLAIYEAFVTGEDEVALMLSLILTGFSLVVVLIGLQLGRKRGTQ